MTSSVPKLFFDSIDELVQWCLANPGHGYIAILDSSNNEFSLTRADVYYSSLVKKSDNSKSDQDKETDNESDNGSENESVNKSDSVSNSELLEQLEELEETRLLYEALNRLRELK
jgi:hypothetical protein